MAPPVSVPSWCVRMACHGVHRVWILSVHRFPSPQPSPTTASGLHSSTGCTDGGVLQQIARYTPPPSHPATPPGPPEFLADGWGVVYSRTASNRPPPPRPPG